MAVEKENGLRVADHLGINRQIVAEDLQDQYYLQTGNLYERKIGELQPRGGSTLIGGSLPSNIASQGQSFTLYDKLLGKTDFLKVGCSVQSGTITNANISSAFVVDATNGKWGVVPAGDTACFIGCNATGIQLVATGFGVCQPINAPLTSGLPTSGQTKKLVVTITSTGINNPNITGIDVYACVTPSYSGGLHDNVWMYVGHIDLIANPTGTFTFFNGPITLNATDPGAGVIRGGPSADASVSLVGVSGLGGTFIPGTTYYVAVLSQYLNYQSNINLDKCYWAAYSVQSVTLQPGQTAISISKNALGSAASLIAIGTHPHLLQPFEIVSNSATFSINLLGPVTGNQMGCVNFLPTGPNVNEGIWFYNVSDFATDEMFAKWNSSANAWQAIGVNNFNLWNTDIETFAQTPPWLINFTGVSTGGDWVGAQYNNQGKDLIYAVQRGNWNFTEPGGYLYTGTTTSGSATITAMSSTANLQSTAGRTAIYGNGIPAGAYIGSISGTTINMVDNTGTALNASGTFSNTPIQFMVVSLQGTFQTNVVETDGFVATLAPPDFGHGLPQQAALITIYKERLIIGGGKGGAFNRCYFTGTQAPYAWGVPGNTLVAQYFQAESGGEEVSGLSLYTNTIYYTGPQAQLLVAKLNTLFVFTDVPVYDGVNDVAGVNQATMIQLSKKTGCANHKTICQTELGTILTSVDNVWLCRDSGEPQPIGQEISYLLRPEDPSIAIDTTYWSAVYHDGHYKLAYSTNGGSVPNQEIWLNLRKMKLQKGQPAWFGPMSGRNVQWQSVEERFEDTIVPKRICVDVAGKNYYQADFESTRQDFGADITYTMQPHIMPFKEVNYNKLWTKLFYEMKVDSQMTFSEAVTMLSTSLGAVTQTNSRTVNPVVGYTGSTYANFVNNCRTKLYLFYPMGKQRGENLSLTWTYTGHILFTIKAWTFYYTVEPRRPD